MSESTEDRLFREKRERELAELRKPEWNMMFCRVCGSGWNNETEARACEGVHVHPTHERM